ncbi:calcium-binding protein [Phaeobacter sp.]|uniref:calcium-binding protein n=1 Tax=Phaeobacter sp. TaxID=1902409 RepID=UPI0025E9DB34|nr:calcium-binding protein [Phaeobacter sp.]
MFSVSGLDLSYSTFANTFSPSLFETAATKGDDLFTINSPFGGVWRLGDGNDTINAGSSWDYIFGGSGTDRLIVDRAFSDASFSSRFSSVTVTTQEGRDELSSIELVQFNDRTVGLTVGSASNETLNGDNRAATSHDVLLGGIGSDTINGYSGNDLLLGEDGNDTLSGQRGNDTLQGGEGDDRLMGGFNADRLFGDSGADTLLGGNGWDRLEGGAQADRLFGGGGADTLKGGSGPDLLNGGSGDDLLLGGGGNDILIGGTGRDELLGQTGDDRLTGGAYADTFVFNQGYGNDTITDFSAGQDLIEIRSGANGLADLTFTAMGDDVQITFANVTILVENIALADLDNAENFLF